MNIFSSTLQASAFKLLLLIAVTSVFSFVPNVNTLSRSTCTMLSAKPLSYVELLQAAKLAKQNNGGAVGQAPVAPVPRKVAPAVTPVSTRANIVEQPFDDATYEHLKFVIGELIR